MLYSSCARESLFHPDALLVLDAYCISLAINLELDGGKRVEGLRPCAFLPTANHASGQRLHNSISTNVIKAILHFRTTIYHRTKLVKHVELCVCLCYRFWSSANTCSCFDLRTLVALDAIRLHGACPTSLKHDNQTPQAKTVSRRTNQWVIEAGQAIRSDEVLVLQLWEGLCCDKECWKSLEERTPGHVRTIQQVQGYQKCQSATGSSQIVE